MRQVATTGLGTSLAVICAAWKQGLSPLSAEPRGPRHALGYGVSRRGAHLLGNPRTEPSLRPTVSRTWNEFWGKLLLVDMHRGTPERWASRERKADWVEDALRLTGPGAVLDLGCGDGLLSICLSRRGHSVVAVDRIEAVLAEARREDDTARVEFLGLDLRGLSFAPESFDAVLLLEVVGLMSKEDDARLIREVATWLRPGGKLAVDTPRQPEASETLFEQRVSAGHLTIRSTYDPSSRLQHLEPVLATESKQVVLRDAYDPGRGGMDGVLRYLYPRDELRAMIHASGLSVDEVAHFSPSGWRMFIGEASGRRRESIEQL